MKAKAIKTGSIGYLGRMVSVVEGMEYNFEDAGLVNLLLSEGLIAIIQPEIVKPEREYKKGKALKSDRAQISMEYHEQKYMRDKIKDFSKEKLYELFKLTSEELIGHGPANPEAFDTSMSKKDIVKMIAEDFAKINSRKKVNKMIKKIKEGEKDGFKDLS